MERIFRHRLSAGLAATVVGAGLVAVAPGVLPLTLHSQGIGVQLTGNGLDAALAAAGLDAQYAFDAIFGSAGLWTDLFRLDLDGVLYDVHKVIYNLIAIPENLAVGGLGALLGEQYDTSIPQSSFLFDVHSLLLQTGGPDGLLGPDPLSDLMHWVSGIFGTGQQLINDLLGFHLADALRGSFYLFDIVVLEIPATLIAGTTQFIWSDMLGMP